MAYVFGNAHVSHCVPRNSVFRVYFHFVYFSVTTMTTVGYGSTYPISWYTELGVLVLEVCHYVVNCARGG